MAIIPLSARREPAANPVTLERMLAFFVPLGISALLITISHVIINSTLARSATPEKLIASYALAMSLIGITERPNLLLRQTCSALVRDRISFGAVKKVTWILLLSSTLFGAFISYSPLGRWIFVYFFDVTETQLREVIGAYRVLMFVSIFSGIRCLYQGIIIYNRRTLWLTIAMVFRLLAMYLAAHYFLTNNQVNSSKVGAIIFLIGMIIECMVALFEGRSLLKNKIPQKLADHPVEKGSQVLQFYRPLLYSSFIAVIIIPAINAILGKTVDLELSIAAFAIATSLTGLVLSFFSYTHQIVLNFYRIDRAAVLNFTVLIGFIPGVLIGLLGYTTLGPWIMANLMGVNEKLLVASLHVLRVFMIMAFLFPWLDFCNGLLMLKGQTKVMIWSQVANVSVTLLTLFLLIVLVPGWNGIIGAFAQSLGVAGELAVVLFMLRRLSREQDDLADVS